MTINEEWQRPDDSGPGQGMDFYRWKLESSVEDAVAAIGDPERSGLAKAATLSMLAQAVRDFEIARHQDLAWCRITGADLVLLERAQRLLAEFPPAILAIEDAQRRQE